MPRRPTIPGVDRRLQILESALDEFAEQGFEGATTKVIAERAGVTQGLVYFYFKSKDDLFIAAFKHQSQQILSSGLDAEFYSARPPYEVIPRFIHRIITIMDEPRNTNILRVMSQVQILQSSESARYRPIQTLAAKIHEMLTIYLESQIELGQLRSVNASLTSQIITSSIIHFIIHRAFGITNFSQDEVAQNIADIFLHGLLP
jgi:AcrR family transcriptional regulator